jgi:hypothetical protein
MAVTRIYEWGPGGERRATEHYDAMNAKMDFDANPPQGLIAHCAGYADDGTWRIVDLWETREDVERFDAERLMPAVQEVVGAAASPPDKQEIYEPHKTFLRGA